MSERTCSVDGCLRTHVARGLCQMHYRRNRREVFATEPYRESDFRRLAAYIDSSGGPDACHPWRGTRDSQGYGHFHVRYRLELAHRWLLGYLRNAPLDGEECALHHCDNPPCCNPRHLYVGDKQQNADDMVRRGRHRNVTTERLAARTHCPAGHPFDAANTYRRGNVRLCRACRRECVRELRRRRSAIVRD